MDDPRPTVVENNQAATLPQGGPSNAEGLLFEPGDLVAGHMRIRRVLGTGGMGQVFEAHDLHLDRLVALKVRQPDMALDALRLEARALAALRHPSLPVVYAFGTHDGKEYMVLERIFGITLHRLVRDTYDDGAVIEVHRALDLLLPVADALVAVHAAGLAHRDVKPLNVMLSPDGRVVLLDFGLALPEATVAHDVLVAGSLGYMAPETVRHDFRPGSARRVDVYALGATVFEVLTGQVPREVNKPADLLAEPREKAADRLAELRPDVPRRLAEVVGAMLAHAPEDRPDAEQVLAEWKAIRSGSDKTRENKRWRVLVVDDDPDVLRVVSFYARRALGDAEVLTASSGKQALSVLAEAKPDVMLLDMAMPSMNGVEVFTYMRGAHLADDCKVIAVSATVQEADAQVLGLLGVDRCVSKGPGLGESLARALSSVLGVPVSTRPPRLGPQP